jgi:hypothetical protein
VVKCDFCAESFDEWDMPDHVWWWHVKDYRCWCGKNLYTLSLREGTISSHFAEHCAEHGGYLAHYLECQMAVPHV